MTAMPLSFQKLYIQRKSSFFFFFPKILDFPLFIGFTHELFWTYRLSLELLVRYSGKTNHPCHWKLLDWDNISRPFWRSKCSPALRWCLTHFLGCHKERILIIHQIVILLIKQLEYILFLRKNGECIEKYVSGLKEEAHYAIDCKYECCTGKSMFR